MLDQDVASATIDISIDTPSSRGGGSGDRGSEDDPNRREMLWRNRVEDLVVKTRKDASSSAIKHENAANRARLLYQLFGLAAFSC